MNQNNIYLLTGPIRTGKTSTLAEWIKGKRNVGGFLTPDINDYRKWQNIETNEIFDFEKEVSENENDVLVGRFVFDGLIFEKARKYILSLINTNCQYIVLDEIGKLELQNKGYEPELNQFLELIKFKKDVKLILVVRDSILSEVIEKYKLNNATIVTLDKFNKISINL